MANQPVTGIIPAAAQNNLRVFRFAVDTGNGTAIFLYDVVKAVAAGGVNAGTAGALTTNVGVVVGIFDSNGIPAGHPLGAVSTKYLPASTAGYVDVALATPDAIFEGTADSSLNANGFAAGDVMAGCNLVATAGNTTTGRSGHVLGAVATGAQKDFQILGFVNDGQNAAGVVSNRVFVHFGASIFTNLATGSFV